MHDHKTLNTETDADLERLYPKHPWWEPLPVKNGTTQYYGCAFCLYRDGTNKRLLFRNPNTVREHLARVHRVGAKAPPLTWRGRVLLWFDRMLPKPR